MCKDGQIFTWMYYRENVFKKNQKFRKSALHVIHFWKIKISLILHMGEMSGFLSQKVEIS